MAPLRRVDARIVGGALAVCAVLAVSAPAVLAGPPESVPPAEVTRAAPGTRTVAADPLSAYTAAIQTLESLGVQPFLYPTAGWCGADAGGLVPAVAGAAPGPWPRQTVSVPGLDLTAVKSGQTLFTFVPAGLPADAPGTKTSGMQVAWLNVATGRGGMASMGTLGDIAASLVPPEVPAELRPFAEQALRDFLAAAIPLGGVRAVPVDTGHGTVLAAVFGTVDNGGRSCFFLPTVGLIDVP
ncbi:hypothetical protein ACWEVD_10365 [Nocardia thailandica]